MRRGRIVRYERHIKSQSLNGKNGHKALCYGVPAMRPFQLCDGDRCAILFEKEVRKWNK